MNYKIIVFGLFLLFVSPVFAIGDNVSVTGNILEDNVIIENTFDNLVLDFEVTAQSEDLFEDLVLINTGSAKNSDEILNVVLWKDNGNSQFDGFAVDEQIVVATNPYGTFNWLFENIDDVVTVGVNRYFVSVESANNGTFGKTFDFSIPFYNDVNSNTDYDEGDTGMFFQSNVELPKTNLEVGGYSYYKTQTFDSDSPKVVLSNIVDEEILTESPKTISGEARDQGFADIETVEICVNNSCESIDFTGTSQVSWNYDLAVLDQTSYNIYVKVTDRYGNFTETDEITVTAQFPVEEEDEEVVEDEEEVSFWENGQFLKTAESSAVYFVDENDDRHVYPTLSVWQSYFNDDFSSIETVEKSDLIGYGLAENVPMKEGSLMEVESLNKYFKVGSDATLQWVKSDATLIELFGSTWLEQVYYLQAGFYPYYTVLDPIE